MAESLVKTEGLCVTLGGRAVLTDVNFEVRAGERVAVMGASGSGKSTLSRAAVGLLSPDEGRVWLMGLDLAKISASRLREVRRKAGMLFQGNALFDSMTVAENMGFVLREVFGRPPAEVSARVDELLEMLRLGPIHGKYPSELSGGMKKRLGIGRAIAHRPGLVFYDDPTAGLDPITSDAIIDLIDELAKEEGQTVVAVSNYPPLLARAADRVMLLQKGRLLDLGPPERLHESDRPEVRRFLGSLNGGGK